jgi:nucleotide-binding universal stress UspA family protein
MPDVNSQFGVDPDSPPSRDNEATEMTIHTILHPTDFSDRSKAAFDVACSLARDQGARLVLLHVSDSASAESADEALVRKLEQMLDERLHALRPDVGSVAVEYRLLRGNPPKVILDVAEKLPADLIVMGTHGYTGLTRALMGSVAEEVFRGADSPVLTVKTPSTRRPETTRVVPTAVVPVM